MGILEKGRVLPLVGIIALCLAGTFLAGADFFEDSSRIDFFGQGDKAVPAKENVTRKPDGSSFNDNSRSAEPKEPILPEVRDVIRRVEKNLAVSAPVEEAAPAEPKECNKCGSVTHTEDNTGYKENVLYYFFAPGCPYCDSATRAVDKFYRHNRSRVEVEGIMVATPDKAIQYYQQWITGSNGFTAVPEYPISVGYTKARDMGIKEVPAFVLTINNRTCRAAGRVDPENFYQECINIRGEK